MMDTVGSQQAALYATADGGLVAMLFAAMHPNRTSALVLNSTWARLIRSAEHPDGMDPVDDSERRPLIRSQWGNVDAPWACESAAPEPSRRSPIPPTACACAAGECQSSGSIGDADQR